jgi:hypothetical protein
MVLCPRGQTASCVIAHPRQIPPRRAGPKEKTDHPPGRVPVSGRLTRCALASYANYSCDDGYGGVLVFTLLRIVQYIGTECTLERCFCPEYYYISGSLASVGRPCCAATAKSWPDQMLQATVSGAVCIPGRFPSRPRAVGVDRAWAPVCGIMSTSSMPKRSCSSESEQWGSW